MRMPLIWSYRGYGLGIGSGHTVLCCDIPMYGTYVYTEGEAQADYYFIYGDYETVAGYHKQTWCIKERKMKILVIEDDQGLRQGIAFSLTQEGYQALQA